MKAGRFFSASAWGAMAIAVAGLGMADIASAAERPHRVNSQGEDRRADRAAERSSNRPVRTEAARPQRSYNADANTGRSSAPEAPAIRSSRQPVRSWAEGRAQVAEGADRRSSQRSAVQQANRDTTWDRGMQRGDERTRNPTENRGDWRGNGRSDWRDDNRNGNTRSDRNHGDSNRYDNHSTQSDYRQRYDQNRRADSNRNYRDWNRNDWRRDNRYDWKQYRSRHRSVYSIGRYYAPYGGYSYRRIGIGFGLSSLFYGNRYWINDPWSYRLPEVYGPYRWVRYYDDVLLVDIYSGQVVDVIYDFFW